MKRGSSILTVSWFIGLAANVMAQTGGPSHQAIADPFPTPYVTFPTTDLPTLPLRDLTAVDEAILKDCCEKLQHDKRRIFYLNARNYKMSLQLKGIYIRQDMLFFRLFLCNHSHLDYDIDSIRFYIADNRWLKKTPLQVTGLRPIYIYGNTQIIRGKSQESPIIVLPRFTLNAGKHLVIELLEKNGGRHLQLAVYNFTLLRSRLI